MNTEPLLIVDHDVAFLEAAEKEFGKTEPVYLARDAVDAKELIHSVPFSAALIDLDMPGQDGFALIRELRQSIPTLPLIAISGVVQEHVLERAKAVGASATLRKPVTPEWNEVIGPLRARGTTG